MKKSFILIAAAVAMFTACEDSDTFRKDIQNNSSENGEAIGFTSFTEKVTKAENSESLYTWTFFDHQESFQVWARKSNQPNKEIFDGTTVSVEKVDPTTYNYTYSPDRYWDKLAENYNFYAAAPDPATITGAAWEWDFKDDGITTTDPTSINKGYFKINDNKFALNGVNLQSKENAVSGKYATANLRNVFKTAKVTKGTTEYKDVDLLIADDAPVARAFYNKANPEAVNLNFIHILSKLNITISTSLPTSGEKAHDVDLLAFEVKKVPNTGSFNENTANLSANKKWIRWTLDDDSNPTKTNIATGIEAYDATTYEIDGTKAVDVPYTNAVAPAPVSEATTPGKIYIVESLIIPQEINYQRVALDGLDHPAVNEPAVPFSSYQEYTESKPVEDPRITAAELNRLTKTVENKLVFKTWDEYKDLNGATNDENVFNELVEEASKVKAVNILAYDEPSEPYFTITYSIDGEVFTANYNLAAAFLNKTNDETKTENEVVSAWEGTFGFYEGWQNTLNIIINPSAIKFTADVAEWSSNTEVSYEVKE